MSDTNDPHSTDHELASLKRELDDLSDSPLAKLPRDEQRILAEIAQARSEGRINRRTLLQASGALGVGALVGGGAAYGSIDTAAADASTSDSDGDIGTPSNRIDIFGDGVDSLTIAAREVPVIDITAYGATPDDGTDDTAAFNSAISEAANHDGAVIRLPNGRIKVDNPDYTPLFTDPSTGDYSFKTGFEKLAVVGGGGSIVDVSGSGWVIATTNLTKANSPGPMLHQGFTINLDSPTGNGLLWGATDSTFRDIRVVGNANTNPGFHGSFYECEWINVGSQDVSNISFAGVWDVTATRTVWKGCFVDGVGAGYSAWWHNASDDCEHIGCHVRNTDNGINGENSPTNIRVIGGTYENLQRRGFTGLGVSEIGGGTLVKDIDVGATGVAAVTGAIDIDGLTVEPNSGDSIAVVSKGGRVDNVTIRGTYDNAFRADSGTVVARNIICEGTPNGGSVIEVSAADADVRGVHMKDVTTTNLTRAVSIDGNDSVTEAASVPTGLTETVGFFNTVTDPEYIGPTPDGINKSSVTRAVVNGTGEETANAETPSSSWPLGVHVDFVDGNGGDGSGTGVYLHLQDGTWSQVGT